MKLNGRTRVGKRLKALFPPCSSVTLLLVSHINRTAQATNHFHCAPSHRAVVVDDIISKWQIIRPQTLAVKLHCSCEIGCSSNIIDIKLASLFTEVTR